MCLIWDALISGCDLEGMKSRSAHLDVSKWGGGRGAIDKTGIGQGPGSTGDMLAGGDSRPSRDETKQAIGSFWGIR